MVTITTEEREQVEKTIRACKECTVAMIDTEGNPYAIPMNFGYANDTIYLHSAPEGNSIRSLEINPNVCITFCENNEIVYQDQEVACSYRVRGSSVICRGKVQFITDFNQKMEALNIIMKQYSDLDFKYSKPAIENVKVWVVEIESMTGKIFGVPYKKSHLYK